MGKLYVFAIGGTGSRVLKALTMLMATGVDVPVDKIVPIIIDPDAAGGNKTDTVSIMDLYGLFNSKISFGDEKTNFFKTPILKLKFPANDYVMPLGGQTNKTFKNYMNFSGFSVEDQALINMLFSDENLDADMTVGFTGNPNIGSVILNQFTESQEFIDFANNFQPGDSIFIISSIFGGTGASGFPLLLKNLRHLNPSLHIPSASAIMSSKIGALTMLPYFTVSNDPKGKIDSDTFISKTKAALSYYESNLGNLDALYYLGDPAKTQYENNPGGLKQRNKAHFMEFVGALSVIDFAKNADSIMPGQNIFKEYGIKNDTREISFIDFEPIDYNNIAKKMTEFTLFCRYMKYQFSNSLDQVWVNTESPQYGKEFYGNMSYGQLMNFVDYYMTWLDEMQKNDRAFIPFNLTENDGDVFGFVKEIPTKRVASFKSNWDLVNDRLNSVKKVDIKKQQGTIEGCFIAHANEAFSKLVTEKIKL